MATDKQKGRRNCSNYKRNLRANRLLSNLRKSRYENEVLLEKIKLLEIYISEGKDHNNIEEDFAVPSEGEILDNSINDISDEGGFDFEQQDESTISCISDGKMIVSLEEEQVSIVNYENSTSKVLNEDSLVSFDRGPGKVIQPDEFVLYDKGEMLSENEHLNIAIDQSLQTQIAMAEKDDNENYDDFLAKKKQRPIGNKSRNQAPVKGNSKKKKSTKD